MASKLNSVQEFYKDKTIFITGASGFMGKVLMEKLLYSCSDLKELIILLRPKRGKTVNIRIKEFEALPMFERIMREKPDVMAKIRVVSGEITEPRLGLNEEELNYVTKNTQIIFHLAASLKLEASLKPNVITNLTATREVVEIAKRMKKLIVMMHTSTAFCLVEHVTVEEKTYESDHQPLDLINCAEWMSEEAMARMQPEVLGFHANTYTYTKRLAENYIRDEYRENRLSVCIVRPSIVGPSHTEPVNGWVDTLNGPGGILLAASKGVLRNILADLDGRFNMIPVDFAINGFIMAVKEFGTAKQRSSEVPVYNLTTHDDATPLYRLFYNVIQSMRYEYPPQLILWYPNVTVTMNEFYYKLNVFLFQWVPAYFVDFLLLIFGQKRFMVRVQTRIAIGMEALKCFTMKSWQFKTKKFQELMNNQSDDEYKMFFIDTKQIKTRDYFRSAAIGGRIYFAKEPLSTAKRGRILMVILYILDTAVKAFIYYWLIKKVLSITGLMDPLMEYVNKIR